MVRVRIDAHRHGMAQWLRCFARHIHSLHNKRSYVVRLFTFFFFSSRRRHTRFDCDWSSDVCSSDLMKIISGMDIADRRRPQDGRSRLRFEGRRIDLRVSTLPTQFGEKVVIRLLNSDRAIQPLDSIDLTPDNLRAMQGFLTHAQGLVLVTGPTGSGKTSTLYTALNSVKSSSNNITTLEDPIEFQLAGINQIQINNKAGLTFTSGLRSILRQDPNVILVGEIRDQETADIALQAAQTGHLLLSTLHTNDATATITRLFDLGIQPFLIASSLLGIVAHRL